MEDGTKEDYEFLGEEFSEHTLGVLVENLLAMLRVLQGPTLGYQVDRYEHSLQSASRALRADESVDMIVGALLHDIGDVFAPVNHSQAAATILKPYVDERTEWVVRHHGLFQGYYYFHHNGGARDARERYSDSPFYDDCVRFCAEFDQNCFDPSYDTLPIEAFQPLLDEVFSRPGALDAIGTVQR
jgi:predicted HD phosphohydrolase